MGKGNESTAIAAAAALTLAVTMTGTGTAVHADVVWGDFETGTTGFGMLTNSGVQPWSPPITGTVMTAPAGTGAISGSQVLKLTGSEGFNWTLSSGAPLGVDFLAQNNRQAFFDHDQIEFDWYAPPNGGSAGWNQLYNIILNSQGGGFVNVAGWSQSTPETNQYYFTGFNGALHHVAIDYTAYKNAVLASANPDGGGWLQLGIQTNSGGGGAAEIWLDNFKFSIAPAVWGFDQDGDWGEASKWANGAVPNAPGKQVTFGPVITNNRTVNMEAPRTAGQLTFNNASWKYTVSGANTLTLDSTSSVGIIVTAGNHDITAPLALAKDLTITGAAGTTLTVANLQPTASAITKTGAGAVVVNQLRSGNLSVQGGTVTVTAGPSAASKVGTLGISGGGKLDLKDGKLITNSPVGTGVVGGGNYTAGSVSRLVQTASNGGAWDGSGLTTSQPDATSGLTSLGVAVASDVRDFGLGTTLHFGGQTITPTSTLVMYTYAGDANLDGQITGDDYSGIDFTIQDPNNTGGWFNGDFNYDGVVTGDDYSAIDFNILAQGAPFPAGAGLSGVAAVPEPATVSALGLGAAALLGRRRRRTN
jgi:hypothetical protein